MVFKLRLLHDPDAQLVFSCGAFCEASQDATILVGGEHANHTFWNVTLGGANELFAKFLDPEGRRLSNTTPARPILLGHNVVLSAGSIVLSGTTVRQGALVGAGAVVSSDCTAFGIHAGVPARLLKMRFDERSCELFKALQIERVHAHHVPQLPVLLREVQSGRIGVEEFRDRVIYLRKTPTVHIAGEMKVLSKAYDRLLAGRGPGHTSGRPRAAGYLFSADLGNIYQDHVGAGHISWDWAHLRAALID